MKKIALLLAILWCSNLAGQTKIEKTVAELIKGLPQPPQEQMIPMAMPMPPQSAMEFSGQGSSNFATVQHWAACSTGGVNCFHAMPGDAPQVFSVNGVTLAVDSNNHGWEYSDYPTNSWTEHTEWGTIYGLQADSNGNIYALDSQQDSYCATIGGGHSLSEWNGSSFTMLTYCMSKAYISSEGLNEWVTIDPNGTLWSNIGGSWAHVSIPSGTFPVTSAAWSGNGHFFITGSNQQIWFYNGSAWSQPSGGTCCSYSVIADPMPVDQTLAFYALAGCGQIDL